MTKSTISTPYAARWHSPRGYRSLLVVKRGRSRIHVVILIRRRVRLVKLPITEEGFMWQAVHQGKPYPLARALHQFHNMAEQHGATEEALRTLAHL